MSVIILLLYLIILACIFGLPFILYFSSGSKLQKKFQMCGNLQGKTRSEVITLIGPPTTQSIQNNNGQVVTFVTWTRASYTVIARFDAKDRFVAIVNQGKNIQ